MNFLNRKSLLDRYMADVNSYLPLKNRKDIVEELRSNLSEKLADQAEEAGAELTEESQVQILSEFGHPLRIAAQYQGNSRSLIGPTLYPFYRVSVLVSLTISTAIITVLLLSEVFFGLDLGVSGPWMLVNSYIYILGVITLGYALTERLMEHYKYLDSWQPDALEQPDNSMASAWGALIACIAAITWLVILNLVPTDYTFDTLLGRNPNPIQTLVLWMKIETLILIPQFFYLIFNQTWSKSRLLLRIGSELILTVGCIIILVSNVEGLGMIYHDLPPSLIAALYYVLWGMIVASGFSAFHFWRKLTHIGRSMASE